MAWRKAKNGNKCSCCSSSSSSSSSSSGSGSDSSSSSESVSFSESSSSSSASSSSSESVGPLGSCCAIDRKYVIAEETYPENEYDEMKDWVRSQRQGREGVGLIFVGPVQLRTKEWYGAVVCMGNEEGGGCDCANIEDGWVCTEGVDALSCYLDGGVPGTGVFTEGGNCDEPCENPLLDCQVGCEGCGCCAEEAPPAEKEKVTVTLSEEQLAESSTMFVEHVNEDLFREPTNIREPATTVKEKEADTKETHKSDFVETVAAENAETRKLQCAAAAAAKKTHASAPARERTRETHVHERG